MAATARRVLVEMLVIGAVAAGLLANLLMQPLMFETRVWPATLLILILIVAGLIAGNALWHGRRETAPEEPLRNAAAAPTFDLPMRRYALMAAFVAYTVAIPYLGFLVATVGFVVGSGLLLSAPRRPAAFAWAVGSAVCIHLIFVRVFDVPLPRGFLDSLGL